MRTGPATSDKRTRGTPAAPVVDVGSPPSFAMFVNRGCAMRLSISTKIHLAAAAFFLALVGTMGIALTQLAKIDQLAAGVCSEARATGSVTETAVSNRDLEVCKDLTTAVAQAKSRVRIAGLGGLMVAMGMATLVALGAKWRLRRLVHVVADVSAGKLEARADARGARSLEWKLDCFGATLGRSRLLVAGLVATGAAVLMVLVTTGGDLGWKVALALLGLVLWVVGGLLKQGS